MKYSKITALILAATIASLSFIGCEKKNESLTPSSPDQEISQIPTLSDNFYDLSTTKQGFGQGVDFDENNRPKSCLNFQQNYGKYDALFIKEDAPTQIVLTFDEGYENGYTGQILDVLKENDVKAVFFITYDYAKSNPDLIHRMIDEGHIVGNHTMTHPSIPTISPEKMEEEIMNLDSYIEENFQYKMNLFRPPMGEFSEQSLAVTQSLGYKSIFWSFAYKDWNPDKQPDTQTALKKQIERLHDGAIYLLHAVSKTNANVLDSFLKGAQEKGYTFTTEL